ncbi:UNVERIFIED_CONTAM: hypothetical protein K2H54_024456 [Gekko kuhli]
MGMSPEAGVWKFKQLHNSLGTQDNKGGDIYTRNFRGLWLALLSACHKPFHFFFSLRNRFSKCFSNEMVYNNANCGLQKLNIYIYVYRNTFSRKTGEKQRRGKETKQHPLLTQQNIVSKNEERPQKPASSLF